MPTHGSLTKAGKVRQQTPKIVALDKPGLSPRERVRRNAQKRFVLGRKPGQNYIRV